MRSSIQYVRKIFRQKLLRKFCVRTKRMTTYDTCHVSEIESISVTYMSTYSSDYREKHLKGELRDKMQGQRTSSRLEYGKRVKQSVHTYLRIFKDHGPNHKRTLRWVIKKKAFLKFLQSCQQLVNVQVSATIIRKWGSTRMSVVNISQVVLN